MAQPTIWTRLKNFASYAASNPGTPYNSSDHDEEFNAALLTVGELRTNIGLIQRDDGKLKNQSVHPDSLSAATVAMLGNWNPRGLWTTGTAYAVRDMVEQASASYVAVVAHTAGASFAIDQAAVKWIALDWLNAISASTGSSLVGFIQSGAGAVARTLQAKMREVEVSLSDFPVVFDDSTDNSTALQSQLDKGPNVTFAVPIGIARFATGLTWTKHRFALYGKCPPTRGNQADAGPTLKYTGTGTGLLLGVSPGVAGTFLEEALIENIRIKVATGTAIALRLYMLSGGYLKNVFVYGSSGAARTGIKVEGCIDTVIECFDVQGQEGAAGVSADYLAKGLEMIGGFSNSPTTTTTFRNGYLHYCVIGVSADNFSIWEDCIFEACTSGIQIGTNAIARLNRCWFEANLTSDVYFGSASETVIENSPNINAYTRQTFFDGNAPKLVVLRNNNFSSSHGTPRFLNPSGSLWTGARIVLDNNILPAGFTINGPYSGGSIGNAITWKNVQVVGMRQNTYRFRQTAVAANTSYNMPQDSGSANAYKMPEKGHVLASYCYYVGANITAGTFDTAVKKNGVALTEMTSGNFSSTPGAVDGIHYRDKFVAGDTLQAVVHTSAAFLATGGEFITEIIVAFGDDGM